jgi:hypothetical protein
MSEKLNAVALAIADALGEGEFYLSPVFQNASRAAIKAMREPTQAMADVGHRDYWHAMIDEALR